MKIAKGFSKKCVSKEYMGLTLIKVEPDTILKARTLKR
jgi:hypothetical protein